MPRFPIEKCSCRDRNFKHLFKAKRLRAKLDLVGIVLLGLAPFVLHPEMVPTFRKNPLPDEIPPHPLFQRVQG